MTTPTMTPAGWYPDPSRRHEFRYWDGADWSPQVSDRGVAASDPQLQPAPGPDGRTPVPAEDPALGQAPPAAPVPAAPEPAAPELAAPVPAATAGAVFAAPAAAGTVAPGGSGYPAPAAPAPHVAGRRGWVIPVVAIFAVLALVAGLLIWAPWASKLPSGGDLYQQMRASAATAKSVRIKGTFNNKGERVQIDIAGNRAGTNSSATIVKGTDKIEILNVSGTFYFKAEAAFWLKNGSAEVARLVGGKYVVIPAGAAAGLGDLKVVTLLDKTFDNDMSVAQKLNASVTESEVNGVPAYLITDKVGSDGSRVYASTTDPAQLMRLSSPKDQGSLDFTEWNAVDPVSAPPASEIKKVPGL